MLYEAEKFLKPITTSTSEVKDVMTRELEKVKGAVERLPVRVSDAVNFNPIAAVFDDNYGSASPLQSLTESPIRKKTSDGNC